MSSLSIQRDLQAKRRHELNRNISLLIMWYPVNNELHHLLKDDMFDKPNQAAFIQLSYYLVNIIDSKKAASLSSVLYDKKSENVYRSQLVSFISSINDEGIISPVMSSHLVNAGGYKVTKLMFQLSQLAMKRAIQQRLNRNDTKINSLDIYKSIKSGEKNKGDIKIEMDTVLKRVKTKTLDWYQYQNKVKEVSELYKVSIRKLEKENESKKDLLQKIVKSLLQCTKCKKKTEDIEKLSDVFEPSQFITNWNEDLEFRLEYLENEWSQNAEPLLKKASIGRTLSESLVNRHTIKDKSSYTLEFNPEVDNIEFNMLEKHVSSQQRYILKNIVKDGVLQMPNLLRAYAIVMCFAFRNVSAMHSIAHYDDVLASNRENYQQIKTELKNLLSDVYAFEQHVRISESTSTLSISPNPDQQELHKIHSFPELPIIKFIERPRLRFAEQSKLTPVHISRLQFILKRHNTHNLPRSHTVFDVAPRGALKQSTFLRHIENVRLDLAELKMGPLSLKEDGMQRTIQHDISKSNQTMMDRSNIFSKQQIARLFTASSRKLSAKKSASKIYEQSMVDDHRARKWNKLFTETIEPDSALYKSHSSPNLNIMHSMRKHNMNTQRGFKHGNLCKILSEDSPESPANESEIRFVNMKETTTKTPPKHYEEQNNLNIKDTPRSKCSNAENTMYSLQNFNSESVLSNEVSNFNSMQPFESPSGKENCTMHKNDDLRTPGSNLNTNKRHIEKSKSIERIIKRYRKLQNASVSSAPKKIDMFKMDDFLSPTLTRVEEKENNLNELNVDVPQNNQLPDLLSPSYQIYSGKSTHIELPNMKILIDSPELSSNTKKRESLGTALGVDITFLDQFDFID